MYWSMLIHLGFNMWDDDPHSPSIKINPYREASDTLRCDRATWEAVTARAAEVGMNHLLIDIGEGLAFESHPELGAKGAWTPQEMADEIARLKQLGIEAVPKLNFSTCHDTWLGDYAFMVSSKPYYRVVADLIAETAEVFGSPDLFHIGMDEETLHHQKHLRQVVIRNPELWYHDLEFYAGEVEKAGSRAWMWSDRIWHHEQEYLARVPKSILQSNWYYGEAFSFEDDPEANAATYVRAYDLLEEHGYDQVPTGANWSNDTNMIDTVRYGHRVIAPERELGYMTAPWYPTVDAERDRLLAAVDQIGESIAELNAGLQDPQH